MVVRPVQARLGKARDQRVGQRAALARVQRMRRDAGRLVDGDQVRIGVQDRQRQIGLRCHEVFLGAELDFHRLPGAEVVALFCIALRSSVQADSPLAN